jgi:hypothetical protein
MPTRSAISMAEAAVLHFASVAKSRNAVLPATPPVTDPLKTTVTKIKVHMTSPQLTFRNWHLSRPSRRKATDAIVHCFGFLKRETPASREHGRVGARHEGQNSTSSNVPASQRGATPEVLEPVRRQGPIDRSAGDRPMAEPALDRPGVVALVGERVATGVAQHVRMCLELHLGGDNYLGRSATIILAGRFGRERRL